MKRKRDNRAFSITELLLALLAAAAVVAIALVGISALRDRRSLEKARVEFLMSTSKIMEIITADVEVAVLNNGFTASQNIVSDNPIDPRYFGLGTIENSNEAFEIQIFKPLNQSLSVPATVTVSGATPSPAPGPQTQYWQKAGQHAQHFLISNDRRAFIFERAAWDPDQLQITPTNSTSFSSEIAQSDFAGPTNMIRTVERVSFRHESGRSQILRTGRFKQEANYQEVIAERIQSFKVGYTFRRRDSDQSLILPELPVEPLTATNLPQGLEQAWIDSECSQTGSYLANGQIIPECVKPHNINDVYFQLVMVTDLPQEALGPSNQPKSDDYQGMRVRLSYDSIQKKVLATIDFRVRPLSYSNTLGTELASGNDVACSPTLGNRCQKRCSQVFNSTDRASPRWVGYGRYVGYPDSQGGASSYCKCWTKTTDWGLSEDSREVYREFDWEKIKHWKASGNTLEENLQTEACGLEYGCNWGVAWKHPGYRLACNCLRTDEVETDHFVLRSPANRPSFTEATGPEQKGHRLQNLIGSDSNLASIVSDGALSRNIKCTDYQSCWSAWTDYFSAAGAYLGGPTTDFFTERCQCLSRDIPYSCDTKAIANGASATPSCLNSEGAAIHSQNIDFKKICNQAARDGGAVACQNTWIKEMPAAGDELIIPPFNVDIAANLRAPRNLSNISFTSFYNIFGNATFASKLGMTPQLAQACECLEKQVTGSLESDGWVEAASNFEYPSSPWNLDFREPSTASASLTPPDYSRNYATDGSKGDKKIPGFVSISRPQFQVPHSVTPADCNVGGNPLSCTLGGQLVTCSSLSWPNPGPSADNQNTLIGSCFVFPAGNGSFTGVPTVNEFNEEPSNTCGKNLCALGFNGFHCCTGENPDALPLLSLGMEPWSGYCNDRCRLNNNPNVSRIDEVRNFITPGDDLVQGCGGSAPPPNGTGAF